MLYVDACSGKLFTRHSSFCMSFRLQHNDYCFVLGNYARAIRAFSLHLSVCSTKIIVSLRLMYCLIHWISKCSACMCSYFVSRARGGSSNAKLPCKQKNAVCSYGFSSRRIPPNVHFDCGWSSCDHICGNKHAYTERESSHTSARKVNDSFAKQMQRSLSFDSGLIVYTHYFVYCMYVSFGYPCSALVLQL